MKNVQFPIALKTVTVLLCVELIVSTTAQGSSSSGSGPETTTTIAATTTGGGGPSATTTTTAAATASTTAIVGKNYDGTFMVETAYEEVVLCGKCSRDFNTQSSISDQVAAENKFYILECLDNPQGNLVGTMKFNCDRGCANCASETEVIIGERVLYESDRFSTQTIFNNSANAAFAASIQCCSHMMRQSLHSSASCIDNMPTDTFNVYYPLGCHFSNALPTVYNGWQCTGHGRSPNWNARCVDTVGGQTETYDECPFRCQSYSFSNAPCVAVEGQSVSANLGQFTYHCEMDRSQVCVRMVGGQDRYYRASALDQRKEASELQCEGGVISGGSTIRSGGGLLITPIISSSFLLVVFLLL